MQVIRGLQQTKLQTTENKQIFTFNNNIVHLKVDFKEYFKRVCLIVTNSNTIVTNPGTSLCLRTSLHKGFYQPRNRKSLKDTFTVFRFVLKQQPGVHVDQVLNSIDFILKKYSFFCKFTSLF